MGAPEPVGLGLPGDTWALGNLAFVWWAAFVWVFYRVGEGFFGLDWGFYSLGGLVWDFGFLVGRAMRFMFMMGYGWAVLEINAKIFLAKFNI